MNNELLTVIIGTAFFVKLVDLGAKIIFDWLKGKDEHVVNYKTFEVYKNGLEARICFLERHLQKLESKIDEILLSLKTKG